MTDETPAQRFVRELTQRGFDPNPGRSAEYVEYAKTYYDAHNNQYVRVFLHFDKPVMGMPGHRLANVTVTTQQVIVPEAAELQHFVPDVAKSEVLELAGMLSTAIPSQAVVTRLCIQCKEEAAEFYVVNDDAICYSCVEAEETSGPNRHHDQTP